MTVNQSELPAGSRLICQKCGNGVDPMKPWIKRTNRRPTRCWKCRNENWDKGPKKWQKKQA